MCHVPEHMKIQLQHQQQHIESLKQEILYLRANPYKKHINAKQKIFETLQRNPQGLRSSELLNLGYCANTLYTYLNLLLKEGKIEKHRIDMRLHKELGRTGVRYYVKELLVIA